MALTRHGHGTVMAPTCHDHVGGVSMAWHRHGIDMVQSRANSWKYRHNVYQIDAPRQQSLVHTRLAADRAAPVASAAAGVAAAAAVAAGSSKQQQRSSSKQQQQWQQQQQQQLQQQQQQQQAASSSISSTSSSSSSSDETVADHDHYGEKFMSSWTGGCSAW